MKFKGGKPLPILLKHLRVHFGLLDEDQWNWRRLRQDSVRLYYSPRQGSGSGFVFFAVSLEENDPDDVLSDEVRVGTVFLRGKALFTGIESMDTADLAGRFVKPSLNKLVATFNELQSLVDEFCQDGFYERPGLEEWENYSWTK